MKHTKNRKLLLYITVGAIFLLVFLRFGLFFLKSEGFSGLSVGIPLLLLGVVIFAFCTSGSAISSLTDVSGYRGFVTGALSAGETSLFSTGLFVGLLGVRFMVELLSVKMVCE